MKKLIFILVTCLVLFSVLAAGCLGGNNSSDNSSDNSSNNTLPNSGSSSNNTSSGSNNSSNNTQSNSNNSSNNTPPIAPSITPPTNTTMFFGKVADIKTANNTTEIIVRNYGSQMSFVFSDSSRMNFNLSDLKNGQYLKVYYNTPAVVTDQKPVPVVVANLLDGIAYDGFVRKITPSAPENLSDIQSIEVASWFGSMVSPMIFHCNETQFFMDLQDMEVGATVSIHGVNITSEDIPQAEAYEICLIGVYFCG